MSEKIASVRVAPGDGQERMVEKDILLGEEVVYFPCERERICGIFYHERPTKKKKGLLALVSLDKYLKELRRLKCKKLSSGTNLKWKCKWRCKMKKNKGAGDNSFAPFLFYRNKV